jgi:hypothetical protein
VDNSISTVVSTNSLLFNIVVPTTDGTAYGNYTNSYNCGYTSSAIGDLVYLDTGATWQKADNTTSVTTYSGFLGVALEVKSSGNIMKVALPDSYIYVSAKFPTLTIGSPVYMSTGGLVVVTQPSGANNAIRVVGWGVHANKMYFNPSPDYIVHT